MNEEIKEILHELDCHGILNCRQDRDLLNYITNLQEENQKLKQWDCNKDTRNSRQRIANEELLKENQKLVKVIDELENYLKEESKYDEYKDVFYREHMGYILNKLTELKGGNND